jgi:hypothetical protein
MPVSSLLTRLALVVAVAAIVGCSPATPAAAYTRISDASVTAVDTTPLPPDTMTTMAAGGPGLELSGRIGPAGSGVLTLDVATIERFGLVKYTVRDPWLEKDLEFTGVLLSDLIRLTGVPADATQLHVTALDDYEVDISIADVKRWPVMLATQVSGKPMSIEDKGPTRIVFPADPTIDAITYKDLWIWQIKTIEVR